MEEVAGRIYRGENVEVDDVRPMLAALGLLDGAALSWEGVHAWLCSLYSLPPQMSPQQIQLFLAYASANDITVRANKALPETSEGKKPADGMLCGPREAAEGCGLRAENDALKDRLALLCSEVSVLTVACRDLREKNQLLEDEVEMLRNEHLDREYENGFFVEDDVLKKIEEENCRLKNLSESVYSDLVRVWFKLVEDKIKGGAE